MAFDVILLGTGSPLPSGNRCGAGNVIVGKEANVLIDCGWGAARRFIASGVPLGSIDHVFFTHMHSDHITDFPDFLMMRWTMGAATKPLHIYGPDGTREVVEGFRSALNPDVRYRIAHHGEKLALEGMECVIHELPVTGAVANHVEVGDLAVGSFEVDHRPVVPAFGFKVMQGECAAVFSGDTMKVQTLVDAATGADVLVSEAVHPGMMDDRVKLLRARNEIRMAEILTEARDYHAPTHDVAEMARDAGVKRLVLSHLIPPIPDDGPVVEQFVAGMNEIYAGPITVGVDLQRFTVGA